MESVCALGNTPNDDFSTCDSFRFTGHFLVVMGRNVIQYHTSARQP